MDSNEDFRFPSKLHPEIIDASDIPNHGLNFTLELARGYFGLFAIFIVPPKNILFPTVPYKCRQKSIFGLCKMVRICVKKRIKGEWCILFKCMEGDIQAKCCHSSDWERGWHCTLNSPDLEAALELGYRVPRCYSIYDWGASYTTTDIFKQMIQVPIYI